MRPHVLFLLAALPFAALTPCFAQQAPPALDFVMPQGDGLIHINPGTDWKPGKLYLYDKGTRPVIDLSGKTPGLTLSYVLFPSGNNNATSESCREDVIRPLLSRFGSAINSKSVQRGDLTTAEGKHLATAAYTIAMSSAEVAQAAGIDLQSDNLFGFFGEGPLCAEVHVSQVNEGKSGHIAPTDAPLKTLTLDTHYKPSIQNYFVLGSIFFRNVKDFAAAALYYDRALTLISSVSDPQERNLLRVLTDQAGMAYGIAGNFKRSREVINASIAKDPDYPMYYYNLACADAETGDAKSAQQHLQQAVDRRANMLTGEKFPDAAKDDSFLKLKKDKNFWAFVQGLPKS